MNPSAFAPAPIKPAIPHGVLESIDIRVGTIERVDDVANSNKLVKLTVNFGDHARCILVGMKKERTNPKEIEGRQALVSSTWRQKLWRAKRRRACCSTSATRMVSFRSWPFRRKTFRTAAAPVEHPYG